MGECQPDNGAREEVSLARAGRPPDRCDSLPADGTIRFLLTGRERECRFEPGCRRANLFRKQTWRCGAFCIPKEGRKSAGIFPLPELLQKMDHAVGREVREALVEQEALAGKNWVVFERPGVAEAQP